MGNKSVFICFFMIFLSISFISNYTIHRGLIVISSLNDPIEREENLLDFLTADNNEPVVDYSDCFDQSIILREESIATSETIVVLVNNSLYCNSADIRSNVSQYIEDLNNTGYNTILYTSFVQNASSLRELLQNWYSVYEISGAVLIGNFPFIEFYHPEVVVGYSYPSDTFICDLYYMDLDGTWEDIDENGIYDTHLESIESDIEPEIYLGRIDATYRTFNGLTNEQNILNVLSRIHEYRTGGLTRSNSALTYIDDSWEAWANGTYDSWPSWLSNAYDNITAIHSPPTWTNASNWLERLEDDYQFAHLCAHSSNTTHYFYNPSIGAYETVSSSEINLVPPSFNFYNLFCCHGAQWNENDCLATTYLFAGDYSLAVIGSTKTGGMLDGSFFYDPLSENKTIGEGLFEWYQGIRDFNPTYYLEWFYGMCILGDPFLTLEYDCTIFPIKAISSSTHPNQMQYYNNQNPSFSWVEPDDVNDIGYYYILDNNPLTEPTKGTGTYISSNSIDIETALSYGQWYFHIVPMDSAGNIGKEISHFRINIAPDLIIESPENHFNYSSDTITVEWIVSDKINGYSHTQIWLDKITNVVYDGTNTETTIDTIGEGYHIINVTVFDNIGCYVSNQIGFMIDLTDPTITITYPDDGATIDDEIIIINWSVSDEYSGCKSVEFRINDELVGTLESSVTSYTISDPENGEYIINITVYDWADNSASDEVQIEYVKHESTSTTTPYPFEITIIELIISSIILIHLKKKCAKK